LWEMHLLTILIIFLTMYLAHVKTHQMAHVLYVQFIIYLAYLAKLLKTKCSVVRTNIKDVTRD
jgi:Ca2+/Na+ antiporter